MNRRDAIRQASRFAGATLLGLHLPVRSWAALAAPTGWTGDDEQLLDLVGDTIIPTTAESPGAGSVGIGRFTITMVQECYALSSVEVLRRGLRDVQDESQKLAGKTFRELAVAQREHVLLACELGKASAAGFRLIKELTVRGYCTSEVGATQALRYLPIPGGFVGSVPWKKGERAWAL